MLLLILMCSLTCVIGGRKYQIDDIKDGFFREDVENDPKENYFRYMRAYDGDFQGATPTMQYLINVPKPGGFRIYYPDLKIRNVRELPDTIVDLQLEKIQATTDGILGKPLEIAELEPEKENTTEVNYSIEPKNDLIINDFIRFKRELNNATDKSVESIDDLNLRPKREHERNGKMLLSDTTVPEGNREPRGATKEQWIKQPYPVRTSLSAQDRSSDDNRDERNYDDSMASATDARAPRVHFVTQRRSESAPPLVYHSYDRESRSRDGGNRRDLNNDMDVNRDMYYQDRSAARPYYTNGGAVASLQNRYDDAYSRDMQHDRRPIDRFFEDRQNDALNNNNKQRRIIYYATLPDIVRTPPNVDLRDRYNYQDNRYESRYISSHPVAVGPGGESYRYRSPAAPYNTKSRYDPEQDRSKASPYPVKVSTDVNVREIKKNPERRYSEVERRYAYKMPNYHDE